MADIKTQLLRAQYGDASFVDTPSLSQALMTEPFVADMFMYTMGTRGFGGMKPYGFLQALLHGTNRSNISDLKPISQMEYQWRLHGQDFKSVSITAAPIPAANVGMGHTEFILQLSDKQFNYGDMIMFEDQSKAIVKRDPTQQGNGWCYYLQLTGNNPNQFVAPNALRVGKQVARVGNLSAEGSTRGGGLQSGGFMMFTNQMSTWRTEYGMTGDAKVEKLKFKIGIEGHGKPYEYMLQYQQALASCQYMQDMERMLWLMEYNKMPDNLIPQISENGYPIRMFSGIREQIVGTNTTVVNEISSNMLQEYLLGLANNSRDGDKCNLVVMTGKGGIMSFNRAMTAAVGNLGTFVVNDNKFVRKGNSGRENDLEFGFQFVKYTGLLNTSFTVMHHPMLDDNRLFTAIDRETGFTAESFNMYFINLGTDRGEPNVELFTRGSNGENRKLKHWFERGSTGPEWDTKSGSADFKPSEMGSSGYDGFKCYALGQCMPIIHDPLSCGAILVQRPIQ